LNQEVRGSPRDQQSEKTRRRLAKILGYKTWSLRLFVEGSVGSLRSILADRFEQPLLQQNRAASQPSSLIKDLHFADRGRRGLERTMDWDDPAERAALIK